MCQLLIFFGHRKLQVAAYDTVQKKMAFFDPSRAKDFLFISGTKVETVPISFAAISYINFMNHKKICTTLFVSEYDFQHYLADQSTR